jgi:hypothetical protein
LTVEPLLPDARWPQPAERSKRFHGAGPVQPGIGAAQGAGGAPAAAKI